MPTARAIANNVNANEAASNDGAHRRERWATRRSLLIFAAASATVPFLFDGTSYMAILTLAAIFGTVAISLDLLLGYTGLLSLGQTAPFGVAAYTAALLSTKADWPTELAAVVGVLAAVAIALVTSPILRLEGFYFALATLAIALIVESVMRNWISLTGGSSGLVGIGRFELGPLSIVSPSDHYWMAWAVMVAAAVVGLRVVTSRFGQAMTAVREDEQAARALGIAGGRIKIEIWLLAAAIAGAAGVVYAHYLRFLSPPQFGLTPSILLVVGVVIGGERSIFGPVIGVVLVRLLPEVFQSFAERSVLVYGIAIIVVTVAMPGGIFGGVQKLITTALRRRRRNDHDADPVTGQRPEVVGAVR